MIKRIEIDKIPPYLCEKQIIQPKKINFLFGLNGSGKTTISRVLCSPKNIEYNNCSITWEAKSMHCSVYNIDYVKENFSETSIPGIFTLGEENIGIKRQIEDLNREIKEIKDSIEKLKNTVDGPEGYRSHLSSHENNYSNKFWSVKQKLDKCNSPLLLALEGVRGSKEVFKKTLLNNHLQNEVQLKDRDELEQLCEQLYSKEIEKLPYIELPCFDSIIELEKNDILKKVIVGKEDVDIANLIKQLGNDSWFKQGVTYLKDSEGKCPFCQKQLDTDFKKKITEYFDESYLTSVKIISDLLDDYTRKANSLLLQIEELSKKKHKLIDNDELSNSYEKLKVIINSNKKKLSEKKESPNITVQLNPVKTISDEILNIVNEINDKVSEYNCRIEHLKEERKKLTESVWRLILEEVSEELTEYLQEKDRLNISIRENLKTIDKYNRELKIKTEILNSSAQKLTSVLPTANGINELLKNYGFYGFSLKVDESENTYQFVREDGSLAYQSLSEGERNFVTFLYFIYSLKGNTNENGHSGDKVVIIDDPVSSLDNDVLFLVSSLLRDLFEDIYNDKGAIKQLFVLSHNLYFFKEVSFKVGLKNQKTGYWTIVKTNGNSKIISHDHNPVSSTYEMLWDEVRCANSNPSGYNATSLANIMRRILEHYFKFLGGIDLIRFHLSFPDGERQVFKSLITWANAGSHSAFDDFSATPSIYTVENYLKVFRKLFEKTNHIAHYNMMMKLEMEEK